MMASVPILIAAFNRVEKASATQVQLLVSKMTVAGGLTAGRRPAIDIQSI